MTTPERVRPPIQSALTFGSERSWVAAVATVIGAVALASIFSPDLVTGAEQEHLPIAAVTDWLWGAVAIAYLAFVDHDRMSAGHATAIGVLWAAVAVVSIFAPDVVTGSDPTRLPLAALVSPVVGTVVTGFLCLHAIRDMAR